ncbi:TetR/AcrR family transcriptional regulator [Paenibacillus sp. OK003]|uniref:TetR/AcrR family transcriptional regulator n=1 Tax=Paenibacillus sp. OK003 TaxID=1884380 RepID=UPI0008B66CCA|nr:TetR/AcrR family transcriptional regulator C-terminal domain-containing protein [Paenibacillus sp. OK003]SEK60268.1 transcriptional regulator, TetR family [Paenibacillus sp. OK003]
MESKPKEDLRVRRTHKLLYNALLELMENQSFENITVKQICDLAMVHRTTFYTHFNDKYDLLSNALRQIAEEELDFSSTLHSPAESLKEILSAARKNKNVFKQLLSEERDSLRNLLRREMGAGIHKHLTEDLLKENLLSEDSSTDIQIIIEAYTGAMIGVLSWWIENNMPIDQEDIYKRLIEMEIFPEWNFLKTSTK